MSTKPNIFLFMVDELRYPTVYDGPELRTWMKENLIAQDLFRQTGVDFQNHYATSTACAPSRTSIFTGQYPSLHGVSRGLQQITGGRQWASVLPPNQLETIVVDLDGTRWKYSRYYQEASSLASYISNPKMVDFIDEYNNVPDQFEMYDLSNDSIESRNLAAEGHPMQAVLQAILDEQRAQKALTPPQEGALRSEGEGALVGSTA